MIESRLGSSSRFSQGGRVLRADCSGPWVMPARGVPGQHRLRQEEYPSCAWKCSSDLGARVRQSGGHIALRAHERAPRARTLHAAALAEGGRWAPASPATRQATDDDLLRRLSSSTPTATSSKPWSFHEVSDLEGPEGLTLEQDRFGWNRLPHSNVGAEA